MSLVTRMGGITGCLALADGAGPDTEWVGRAAMRLVHRGPDDDGYFADADLALAFRRLAVIDPSPGGRQPMQSADGRFVMVFDGEIYNYVELAQRLLARGTQLRGRSSAEVLLETYAWLGKDVVRQLRGMYAFAIWDRRTRELFCARDPFGIKPFYYALTAADGRPRFGPQLRFASERKALADSGEVAAIDPDALRRYLSFQYVPAPATLTPPARSLPPGHVLIARPGGRVDVFRYWRPELRPARSPSSGTPERILTALRDSVAVHMRSEVPDRRVPVRRDRLGHPLRARGRAPSRPDHLHRRVRARGLQRDRPGAGDGDGARREVRSLRDHRGGVRRQPAQDHLAPG